jgi:hypothetical protein
MIHSFHTTAGIANSGKAHTRRVTAVLLCACVVSLSGLVASVAALDSLTLSSQIERARNGSSSCTVGVPEVQTEEFGFVFGGRAAASTACNSAYTQSVASTVRAFVLVACPFRGHASWCPIVSHAGLYYHHDRYSLEFNLHALFFCLRRR